MDDNRIQQILCQYKPERRRNVRRLLKPAELVQ